MNFALNHIVSPRRSHAELFDLAVALGVDQVEIRNDLAGVAIADGTAPETVRADAAARGLTILSINALQRFNHWTPARADEARALAAYASACGAKALVLCPVNDTQWQRALDARLAHLREALAALLPILKHAGLTGLVEPLGFAECSLRLKAEAVAAIDAIGGAGTFRLVHDTFHHAVAGETQIFPAHTGLVHISGVDDPAVPVSSMRDPHRVLVGRGDRIGNVAQMQALLAGGYAGYFSFEPFSEKIHALPDIGAAVRASMALIQHELHATA